MPKLNLAELYKTQISLSEWFDKINHTQSIALREEDNKKRERLAVVSEIIPLPFDRPVNFLATDLSNKTEKWMHYLEEHGNELCALRLMPIDPSLPKLRMRGQTVRNVFEGWFIEQNIDPSQYLADIVPHCETGYTWSTIFVVNAFGVFGEIIEGTHAQLTQGFHETTKPIAFSFDWNTWTFSESHEGAQDHVEMILRHLHVADPGKQQALANQVNATFAHDHIQGYFETVHSEAFGLWFIDYNRILGTMYGDFKPSAARSPKSTTTLSGRAVSPGKAHGRVCVMRDSADHFEKGDVLVCEMTTPDFLPAMQLASAIVTVQGGLLSHAAITARELHIPCIVGCSDALELLHDGDEVDIDCTTGTVHKSNTPKHS